MSLDLSLLQDFALVMVVAGATALLCRWLRQPTILGYLLAGVIVGPYTVWPAVRNLETIRQLSDLGIVLLLFGLGLEFGINRLRAVGLVSLVAGGLGILLMLVAGYEVGLLLGWSSWDSLFLGAALSLSSTMVIIKVLAEMGRLRQEASRIMVGILVVQDFAAVAMIALFSGATATGRADLGGFLLLVGKLGIFALVALGLGPLVVHRLLELAHRFQSREVMLVTGLALCFALVLLGQQVGLSVAAGAFLMGAIIAPSRHSDEMMALVTPLRDIFAALFFVTIGIMLDIRLFPLFVVPALILFALNLGGKTLSLALGSLVSGYSLRTAIRVGMGMAAIGEFSLVIAKVGLDSGVVGTQLYPTIVVLTALTTLAAPYLIRFSDPVSERLDRLFPLPLKEYLTYGGLLQRSFRHLLRQANPVARVCYHCLNLLFLNVLIVAALWGGAAIVFSLARGFLATLPLGQHLIGLLLGLAVLVLSLPSLVIIWRNLRTLVHTAVEGLLQQQASVRFLGRKVATVVFRDTLFVLVLIGISLPALPLASYLLAEGSFILLAVPLLAALAIGFLFWDAIHHIHQRLEATLRHTLVAGQTDAEKASAGEGKEDGV